VRGIVTFMNKRVIKVCIEREPELYEELMAATLNHIQYDGCYIMQYAEYWGDEGQKMGEFMLHETD